MSLTNLLKIFLCSIFSIGTPQCLARQRTFYLVTGKESLLECKTCTRKIKFV